jgi:hypothetical protein
MSILLQVIFASDVNSPALPIVLLLAALTQLGIMLLVRNKV